MDGNELKTVKIFLRNEIENFFTFFFEMWNYNFHIDESINTEYIEESRVSWATYQFVMNNIQIETLKNGNKNFNMTSLNKNRKVLK